MLLNLNICKRFSSFLRKNISFFFLLFILLPIATSRSIDNTENQISEKSEIQKEMKEVLENNIFASWYPRSIDKTEGGFYSNFDSQWNLTETQIKMIVTQARHTWTTAQANKYFANDTTFKNLSFHGFKFLKNKMWDKINGGFFNLVSSNGEVIKYKNSKYKTAYGNAFAIYGLSACYEVTQKKEVLDLAINTYNWLEKHSYDKVYGGYYQFIDADGYPLTEGENGVPPKDQNSTIHILEAYTELYRVWPDEELKYKIIEIIELLRDTIISEKGSLILFFTKDWQKIYYTDKRFVLPNNKYWYDHVSFGHDVEVAYLIIEAMHVIDNYDKYTENICKKLVDHAIENGFESETGAMPDMGYYFDSTITIIDKETSWWAAAESMNSFLLMANLYPNDPNNYYEKFIQTWDYCKKNLIDYKNGGWYRKGLNKGDQFKQENKGGIWKANYHNSRALINCIKFLSNKVEE